MKILIQLWLRTLISQFAAGDIGMGGGAAAEAPPVGGGEAPVGETVEDVPADGEEQPKSDMDILNEEESEADTTIETAEQKAAREKEEADSTIETAEQKAAKAKIAAAAKPVVQQTAEEKEAEAQATLENRPIEAIRAHLAKNPALKAAIEGDKVFMNRIFTDARRSARLGQYTPHFATAELAAQGAADLQVFDGLERPWYSDAPDAPKTLLEKLMDMDTVKDKDGKPVLENGRPKTNGRYVRLMSTYRELGIYPTILTHAERISKMSSEDQLRLLGQEVDYDEFQNFVGIMQRLMGDAPEQKAERQKKSASTGENVDDSKLSSEQKRLLEIGRSADTQQQTNAQKQEQEFNDATKKAIVIGSKGVLGERVKSAAKAFNEGTQAKILDDSYRRIAAMAKADIPYQRQLEKLQQACKRGDITQADLQSRLVIAAKVYVRERQSKVVAEVVKEYGSGAVAQSEEKHVALNQRTNGQKEPRTQGANTKPTARSEIQMVQEATKLYTQLHGRQPRENDILDFDEEYVTDLKRRLKEKGA